MSPSWDKKTDDIRAHSSRTVVKKIDAKEAKLKAVLEPIYRKVRRAYDFEKLKLCLQSPDQYFEKYGKRLFDEKSPNDFFIYGDRNSNVLGVAHLDFVSNEYNWAMESVTPFGTWIWSPRLDDRLGVYVICELLPALGIKPDILLTTGEETGRSTAQFFKTDRKYNWMFQFDRTGEDVVMYQYDRPVLRDKLEGVGMKTAHGSFSDICKLGDLGCLGFNVGVGYEDYHSYRAKAVKEVMFRQVARFVYFWSLHSKTHLPYTPLPVQSYGGSEYSRGNYSRTIKTYRYDTTFGEICSEWEQGREYNHTVKGYIWKDHLTRAKNPTQPLQTTAGAKQEPTSTTTSTDEKKLSMIAVAHRPETLEEREQCDACMYFFPKDELRRLAHGGRLCQECNAEWERFTQTG